MLRCAGASRLLGARSRWKPPPLQNDLLLHVDRLKLQHILGHLVANAIKFSREGATITLEADAMRDNGQLRLRVHDTGGGMSRDKLSAIVPPCRKIIAGSSPMTTALSAWG